MEQPTFAERTATLKLVAEHLKQYAEIVMSEAVRMEAAQVRFRARVEKRPSRTKSARNG